LGDRTSAGAAGSCAFPLRLDAGEGEKERRRRAHLESDSPAARRAEATLAHAGHLERVEPGGVGPGTERTEAIGLVLPTIPLLLIARA
jgi:hypothetical protein